jgi:23S rRNA pseudouridine1911/1915/1917 synthase
MSAVSLESRILFEDNHLIIVNKLPGELVQMDTEGTPGLEDELKAYIKKKYNKPGDVFLGVAHRLDRPTSGVVLFARTSKALVRLNESFKDRSIHKTYWAVVKNKPLKEEGHLIHYLLRDAKKNLSKALDKEVKYSQRAELKYTFKGSTDNYHLLEIDLMTGRHHQIRAQLSKIGSPIKGDLKYGSERSNKDGSIHLHARKVELIHPVKKESMVVIAPPPEDPVWNQFKNMA